MDENKRILKELAKKERDYAKRIKEHEKIIRGHTRTMNMIKTHREKLRHKIKELRNNILEG